MVVNQLGLRAIDFYLSKSCNKSCHYCTAWTLEMRNLHVDMKFTSRILKARGGAELSKIDKASNAADQNMTHTGFNSGTYYVEITNTHPTDITGNVDSMTFGFFWICALSDGTGGKLRSDPTDENSFNTSSRGVRTIIPSNQTTSGSYPNAVASFSDPVTLLCKPRALTTP